MRNAFLPHIRPLNNSCTSFNATANGILLLITWLSLLAQSALFQTLPSTTKHKSSQAGPMNMTVASVYSNGRHSSQIPPQSSTSRMVRWNRMSLQHRSVAEKVCRNGVMLWSQHGPKPLRNISSTLLNPRHKYSRLFWRQNGGLPSTI